MTDDPAPTPRRPRDDMASPVDLPGSQLIGGSPLGWTTLTIAVAALFLALTNAVSINSWAAELEPSPTSARIVAASEWWLATSDALGLGGTRAAMHRVWKGWQAARFEGQAVAAD